MTGYRWHTVRKWRDKYHMPMHLQFNGKPYIYPLEIEFWERLIQEALVSAKADTGDGVESNEA